MLIADLSAHGRRSAAIGGGISSRRTITYQIVLLLHSRPEQFNSIGVLTHAEGMVYDATVSYGDRRPIDVYTVGFLIVRSRLLIVGY